MTPGPPAQARPTPGGSDADDVAAGFVVRLEAYQGDLGGLAAALRSGRVAPARLDLLALVRDVLAWFERVSERDLEAASVALPQVARVVELKLRLLLPRPPREYDEDDEDVADTADALEAVALLEELESAIDFLRRRRFERAVVVPAQAPRPALPRERRPLRTTASRLAELASHLRPGGYFEMTRERLTLESALTALRRALARLGRGTLDALHPAEGWAQRTVVFAAMLELVREGRARAHQDRPYAPIRLDQAPAAGRDDAARGEGRVAAREPDPSPDA